MMNKMRTIHPGEVLREEFLLPMEISANALAKALHVPAARINEIAKEQRGITVDTALRLSQYFGTGPEFWLNMQHDYDLKIGIAQKLDMIQKEITPMTAE